MNHGNSLRKADYYVADCPLQLAQGHDGSIYRASNWEYVGRTGPYPRWIDPETGRQVAPKATKNRTKQDMLDLGYVLEGRYHKHKYVLHL